MKTPLLRAPLRAATALCAAVLIAACSTPQTATEDTGEGQQVAERATAESEKPAKESGKATLKKAGFGRDGDYGWVSAIVTNSSSENVGKFVTVQFNLLDSKGDLVASQEQVGMFTRPTRLWPSARRSRWLASRRSRRSKPPWGSATGTAWTTCRACPSGR